MRWVVLPVDLGAVERLSRQLNISPLVARLLVRRGLQEAEAAHHFLHPGTDQLHDPFLMADMSAAVERLRRAIAGKEKILIYGDYDVDGAMAVVVLMTALGALGANVEAYIPHRLSEGYGMRAPVVERAAAEGVRVLLSVDTGVREHEVIARARGLGIDCIVTDHHLPDSRLPAAHAILNPRRADCAYPEKNLSGVGVAFKLAQALLGERLSERQLLSYLKIVAIGTIADVVPLLGENRVIARLGLAALGSVQSKRSGLQALLAAAGLDGRALTAGDVAFRIAPRLNAAGRMDNAREVIELLTTADDAKGREIAQRLEGLNRERQRVEDEVLGEITSWMEQQPEKAERYSLVFSGQGWHRGVIGIVAQRLAERYYRPTLVIAIEDGVGHGSCRSIPGFHILDALTAAHSLSPGRGLFERYGGHAQAAGFTLPAGSVGELETRFERCARALLRPEDLEPVLRVDAELDLAEIDGSLYEQLSRLEPYGAGNPTPVFAARGLGLVLPPRVLQEKHLKLKVAQRGKTMDALGWGRANEGPALVPGRELDLAFSLDENVFQEIKTLQLVIRDLRLSEGGQRQA
jgi:single-stranded-DNA-specific exonuclease